MEILTEFCSRLHLLDINALSKIDNNLKNIAKGPIASKYVNIIDVKACGQSILEKMELMSLLTFTFK